MAQTIEELRIEDRVLEIAELFPRQGEWTEDDYFRLPETNKIVELSEGRLIISPSPTPKHQRISANLFALIQNYVRLNSLGEICYSPLDVRLWEGNIRHPDIVFMSNKHRKRITTKFWGVPDLVVEIISKGNEKQDRLDKFEEYEKAGVLEYWIVDPFKKTVEVFTIENKAYVLLGKWENDEIAYSKLLDGFQVPVNSVFE